MSDANITKSLTQPQPTSGGLQVSVNISAPYGNLLVFLSDLENMRRPLLTQSSSAILDTEAESEKITLTINGTIPFIPRPIENSI